MNTNELIKIILQCSRIPEEIALRMALIFTLYNNGYKTQHIALAMNICRNSVTYACQKVRELVDINDNIMLDALSIVKEHSTELVPYFVKGDKTYQVKAYLEIDNVKLLN